MIYILLILALGMLFTVFRIARDIFNSYQCVDQSTLRSFMYGRIGRESRVYKNVIAHLGQCEKCRDALSDLQRGKRLEDNLIED